MLFNYQDLLSLQNNSLILKMFRADNFSFVMSFLYKIFRPQDKIIPSYPYESLIIELEKHISYLDEMTYMQKKSKDYLDEWASDSKGIILKTFSRENEIYVSLSADTEKVMQWLDELMYLQLGGYVATDSRFNDIFNKLKEIKEKSVINPQEKLAQLREQKERIEREIREIEIGENNFEVLKDEQIIERFLETTKMAKYLITDFKQVEKNIKQIVHNLYERQLNPDLSAGSHLEFTYIAKEELSTQPQGKSFEAFLGFQRDINKQEELDMLIDYALNLPYIENLEKKDTFLVNLKESLTIASLPVHTLKTDWISELNRAIVRHNNDSNKKITELVADIKRLVIQSKSNPPSEKFFMEIEGKPEIYLPLERKINFEHETTGFKSFHATDNEQDEEAMEREREKIIKNLNPKEKEKLNAHIQALLMEQTQVSLKTILARFPITNGFSELLSYLQIAALSSKHIINTEQIEEVIVSKMPLFKKQVTIPQIIFRR